MNVLDPLELKYRNVCDIGLISEKKIDTNLLELSCLIGEFSDVYSVAKNNKELAALDFSSYGKRKLKKLDLELINKVIDFCNYKGVEMLHNKQTGGMYLKTIFFLPHNYNNALKLMKLLWVPTHTISIINHKILIGLLLGYTPDNIIYYLDKNYNIKLTSEDIKKADTILNNINVSYEDLQKSINVVYSTSIKRL